METIRTWGGMGVALAILAVDCPAQPVSDMVVSSDPGLGALAARLLPDLAFRAGMDLKAPVRLEFRSRQELVRYLESKLDDDLPEAEAQLRVEAYTLLGLVPPGLDLRTLLLRLYTEQVAGFYEPDSTALFVMDDQPNDEMEALLVHELVHAVQDQSADLGALTDAELDNDRATAAQAAIEGHATLIMLEYMMEQMTGASVDLSQNPDLAAQVRPALERMTAQFPALAGAPRVIRETLLFPYLEGAGFVQRLWVQGERVAPFGASLPESTEQVMARGDVASPIEIELTTRGSSIVHEDVLGRFALGILLEEVMGISRGELAESWDGDRYALVEQTDGARGLVSFVVWDSLEARDSFAAAINRAPSGFGGIVEVERLQISGQAATKLTVGSPGEVSALSRGGLRR